MKRSRPSSAPARPEKNELLQSAPGIGPVLSATLQNALPELGGSTSAKSPSWWEFAPLRDDSRKRSGARHIRGGRAEVRTVLYMATLTATRFNPLIKTFYRRSPARGKAQKVAIIAAMRKFLIVPKAMLKTQTF
jgi:transposase